MSFEEAKAFIQKGGFISRRQFQKWSGSEQRPKNFPSTPDRAYSEEWTNWSDFLGIGNISNSKKRWMSFEEVKKYVRTLKFEDPKDFIEWLKSNDRPVDFPPNPHQVYPEWTNLTDFLSTKAQEYISYEEAKTVVQQLVITSLIDFVEIKKNEPDIFPENFPSNPKAFFTETGEWVDWNDFLGLTDRSDDHKENVQNAEDFTGEGFDQEESSTEDFTDDFLIQDN